MTQSSYPTANPLRQCLGCGKDLSPDAEWFIISSPLVEDWQNMEGPYCYECIRFSPTTAREEE